MNAEKISRKLRWREGVIHLHAVHYDDNNTRNSAQAAAAAGEIVGAGVYKVLREIKLSNYPSIIAPDLVVATMFPSDPRSEMLLSMGHYLKEVLAPDVVRDFRGGDLLD